MVTDRELAEAHAFARRRLVQAFVSGRDVEPPQPGRAVLASLVLAGLLVAGAALLARIEAPAAEVRPEPPSATPAYPRAEGRAGEDDGVARVGVDTVLAAWRRCRSGPSPP